MNLPIGDWFFDGWTAPLRVLVVGASAYLVLILLLRISGTRTLSKMNAFDFVVTVAIGSTLATVLLSKGTAWVEGVTALALLIFLQWLITWLSTRSTLVTRLIKAEPVLLVREGRLLHQAMHRSRVIEADILQAVRQQGKGSIDEVAAIVLETDGSFSVIPRPIGGEPSAMANVDRDPVARQS
jgi:uncharacterized membrane protein YcaP (DUF421 family)